MAAVKSNGNTSTELKLIAIFRRLRIAGWRRRQKLIGQPDFVFRRERIALFVDGCFWHGCRKHLRLPETNRSYWLKKISANVQRDVKTTRLLRQQGWITLRLWEHDLVEFERVARKLKRILDRE
jgi:DNA mismatch endonuclease, patch repair protein